MRKFLSYENVSKHLGATGNRQPKNDVELGSANPVRRQLRIVTSKAIKKGAFFFLLTIAFSFRIQAQRPNISYSPSSYNFTAGFPITNISAPNNSGGSIPSFVRGSVLDSRGIGSYDVSKIFVDNSGNIFSTNFQTGKIMKIPTGSSTPQVLFTRTNPWGIVADAAGNIYWTEMGECRVQTADNEHPVGVDVADAVMGALGGGALLGPALDVYDQIANGTQYEVEYTGKIYKLAAGGSEPEEYATNLQLPAALAIDASGNLYVTGFKFSFKNINDDGTVVKIAANGQKTTITSLPGLKYPADIAIDNNIGMYVSVLNDALTRSNILYIPNYFPGHQSGHQAYDSAQLRVVADTVIEGMAVDGIGNLYFSKVGTDPVLTLPYTAAANANPFAFSYQTVSPYSMVLDPSKNSIWVKDGKYTTTGGVKKLALYGYGVSPELPQGLTLNSNGTISGTPQQILSSAKSFSITAANASGQSSASINIGVSSISVPSISYSTSSYNFPVKSAITTISKPANSGGDFSQQLAPVKRDSAYKGTTFISNLTIGSDGNVYFAEQSTNGVIKKYDVTSKQTTVFLSSINYPAGMAFNKSGGMYFSERGANAVKLKLPNFASPTKILNMGTPSGIAIDDAGLVYLENQGSGIIVKYDPQSNTVTDNFVTGLTQPYCLAYYGGYLYIMELGGAIKKVSITAPSSVSTITTIPEPSEMIVDGFGNIFVSKRVYGEIVKIPAGGNTASTYSQGFGISYPYSIAVNGNSTWYVSDGISAEHLIKITTGGYSVSPALPAGLALNADGTITGTPTVVSGAQNYTISANNSIGNGTATLNITISNIAPATLQYTTSNNFLRGTAIAALTPTVTGGIPTSYSISPSSANASLPTGLSLNSSTGEVTGTPTTSQASKNYTIRASNSVNYVEKTISITISDQAIAALQYNFPHNELMMDYNMGSVLPTYTGSPATLFSINPALPAGLSFNTTNGTINGKPTVQTASTSYTVTATNGAGNATTTFSLSVTPAAIPNISYSTTSYTFTKGTPITTIAAPANAGNPFPQQRIRDTAILGTTSVTGVALDAAGNAYVAYSTGGIKKLPKGGTQLEDFISSGISTPVDLAIDKDNNMYVSEGSNKSIKKIVLSTKTISTFANSGLGSVQGLCISKANDLYVADSTNSKIIKYTNCVASNKFEALTGLDDDDNDAYHAKPFDVAIDTSGNMYVLLSGPWNNGGSVSYIFKYPSGGGARSRVKGEASKYRGLAVDKTGNVYFSVDGSIVRINTFDNSGNGGISSNLSNAFPAYGLALDADENLYYGINSATAATGGLGISYQFGYNITGLPAGLTLNPTGTITGTPTTLQSQTAYSVTASTFYGSSKAKLNIAVVDTIPSFSYTPANNSLTKGTAMSLSPVKTGGPIAGYTITPTVYPQGISFNSTTGIFSGTPTQLQDTVSTYIISATNTGGTVKDTVTFIVKDVVPSGLSYTNNNVFLKGQAISSLAPTVSGGPVTKYKISPALTTGLYIDSVSGVISGKPTLTQGLTNYTVTASNSGGQVTFIVKITINDVPPAITYGSSDNYEFQQNVMITPIPAPVNIGSTVNSYSISPALPSGLALNTTNGTITGTPTVLKDETVYTVTAINTTWGSGTAQLTIAVVPLPPDSIKYNTPVTIVKGIAMANESPTLTTSGGGAITSYSISPALPQGLSINNSTGVISGTAVNLSDAQYVYKVTAENSAGKKDAYFLLHVKDKPVNISYAADNVFTVGTVATLIPTSTGGAPQKCVITPALPAGLTMDSVTGIISGTPAAVSAKTSYTVTASNHSNPETTATFYLTINDKTPVISYATPVVLTKGTSNNLPVQPSSTGGTPVSYSINNALPAGLSLNTTSGVISGTPTVLVTAADYVITATNTGGSANFTINLKVIDKVPGDISYTAENFYGVNTPMTDLAPVIANGGGDIVSYSISPAALPAGLSFNTTTGVISGTPTALFSETSYTVTATNTGGNKQATFKITVYKITTSVTSKTDVSCNGAINGSATVSASGGVGLYTYSWSPSGGNSATAVNLAASDYTCTITDANNVSVQQQVTITEPPAPTINTISNQALCNGAATTAVSFSGAVNGTTYSWTNDNSSIGLAASGNGDIATFNAINTGATSITATITVTPVVNGCIGTAKTFAITVKPTATVNTISNQTVCNGTVITSVNFSGGVSNTTYNWTNDKTAIGLAGSGSGDIAAFTALNTGTTPVIATITVTPVANGCTGAPETFTVTVNPTATVNAVDGQLICNGAMSTAIAFDGTVSGTTYKWTNDNSSIGLAASGSGDIASFTALNTGTDIDTATITVTPVASGCPGASQTFIISVSPTASVNTVNNQTVCNGATTTSVSFGGPVTGTTYSWTNNNTSIGLAASGNGSIASFTAVNTGITPVTATITVTPIANGCIGTPIIFTITVNPTATVNAISNQTLCNNTNTTAVSFSGDAIGTTYNWTNNNTSIGLAANGSGNIASFTAVNIGSTAVVATITVTPVANGCTGIPKTFTITVDSTATVNAVSNQTICNGAATTAINFGGVVTGTTYNWTNNNTSIGLAASGSGDIASFNAINNGTSTITATITVTPIANGCTGIPEAFTITVNPTATLSPVEDVAICNQSNTSAITFSGAVGGTTYSWKNDKPSIGLAANGTGSIASFQAVNSGLLPDTAIITVTPSANGCTGTPQTFTIIVNPTPTITCPANIVIDAEAGTCGAIVNYPEATATGTPAPVLTYSIPSGTLFPVGITTITVTATTECGTVTCSFTVTVNDVQVPAFTKQPVDTEICSGQRVSFYAKATHDASYQWQLFKNGNWRDIESATDSVYTIFNVTKAMDKQLYRVVVSGPCTTATISDEAILGVNALPVISLSASPLIQLKPTDKTAINTTVDSAGGVYTWYRDGDVVSTVNTSSLQLGIDDIGEYKFMYTDTNGCISTSSTIKITARKIEDNMPVFPNPSDGKFYLRTYTTPDQMPLTVQVSDSRGNIVYQQKATTTRPYERIEVDLKTPVNGIYNAKVINAKGKIIDVKRVVVIR